ncbi:hypothetical protein FUAX_03900 [Fulvitalea axinellae]|uniref:Uncharacterized protein n=1 Tax=Fulvitalea axinellae TaxID=1182444 RepID=A0AAU9CWJ8_9BACT|nr:hypothetical protein FUAX_03900 [Fulvitalea axinellae]
MERKSIITLFILFASLFFIGECCMSISERQGISLSHKSVVQKMNCYYCSFKNKLSHLLESKYQNITRSTANFNKNDNAFMFVLENENPISVNLNLEELIILDECIKIDPLLTK